MGTVCVAPPAPAPAPAPGPDPRLLHPYLRPPLPAAPGLSFPQLASLYGAPGLRQLPVLP